MKMSGSQFIGTISIGLACLSIEGNAEEVIVRTPEGNCLTVEVAPDESFCDVIQKIAGNNSAPVIIDFMHNHSLQMFIEDHSPVNVTRVYTNTVTAAEKDDIRYILKSLATNTWTELLGSRSSINRAGDRIDHIHPLRFLACIFTDKELKGCIHTIRDRGKIWKSFFQGLEESLEEESQKGNIQPDMVQDFAKNVNVNVSAIREIIKNKKWEDLVDTLLNLLPREGDPGRYDM